MSGLSVSEQIELSHLERDIERGKDATLAMAKALLAIRDRQLYRQDYRSFEAYCQERWGFGERYGRMLTQFAENVVQLQTGTMVPVLPANERQSRPLNSLPEPEDKAHAMAAAAAIAPTQPTARHVARAAAAVKAKPTAPTNGARVTVLDERSPHFGAVVTVARSEGVIVVAQTPSGDEVPFLTTELADANASPAPTPAPEPVAKVTRRSPLEAIEAKLELERVRNRQLDAENQRLRQLLTDALKGWDAAAGEWVEAVKLAIGHGRAPF
ncbi:MAG TPA: hypothetical protein V6C88_17965 [Chroococcidiopsis sp.]